ncbi:hypothetical protein HYFRA_00009216 [Hymenoscyphus fraxineus]|uniref:Uncharacterized protein n=1 Tax=Hymenoscyphus fraxineus TaxID=746836 RepID=A0A9N9PU31_9HELO|nr:hypothetical protein HYFRA_00009216 [Hymenoscyphus fraxineus]
MEFRLSSFLFGDDDRPRRRLLSGWFAIEAIHSSRFNISSVPGGFVFQTPIAQVLVLVWIRWIFGMGHSPHIKWVSSCDSGTLFVPVNLSGQSGS